MMRNSQGLYVLMLGTLGGLDGNLSAAEMPIRCFVVRDGKAYDLSEDHKPSQVVVRSDHCGYDVSSLSLSRRNASPRRVG